MSQSESAPTPPLATLAYAQGSSHAALIDIRPYALLLPNIAAIVVCFLPISHSEPPIGPILAYVRHFFGSSGHSNVWEAFITGPFLLSIPLAIWTIRLCIQPRVSRRETIIAWSMTVTALTMTLLATGFATVLIRQRKGFILAVLVTIALLLAAALAAWKLRTWRSAYPPALLAMTAVYAANTTLTVLVVRTHSAWESGGVAGAIVVAAQIIAMIISYRRWHSAE